MNVARQKHTSGIAGLPTRLCTKTCSSSNGCLLAAQALHMEFLSKRDTSSWPNFWRPNLARCVLCLLAVATVSFAIVPAKAVSKVQTEWQLPLAPNPVDGLRLVEPYRQPNSDYSAGHRGVDYQVAIGQPILAPADGVVWHRGLVVNRNLISLRHSPDLLTEFEPVCSNLTAGDQVVIGQKIGETCPGAQNYQHCKVSTCLHFSMRKSGAYLSPLAIIGGLFPSRLLPKGL